MSRRTLPTLAGLAALASLTASGCGDVPTLDGGIAYITFTLPSPAVGVGDVLRDSLGQPAPLRVRAFDRDGNEVAVTGATWISTPVPVGNGVTVDANGGVTAGDTTATVQIVGRVGDRLQTTPATLLVVPQPDAVAPTIGTSLTMTAALPVLDTLRVTVTGLYKGARTGVQGIVVRFHIDGVYRSAGAAQASAVLTNDAGVIPRPDSTTAVDTTDTGGNASRMLVVTGGAADSVVVGVRALTFSGLPLSGSPVRFVLYPKP